MTPPKVEPGETSGLEGQTHVAYSYSYLHGLTGLTTRPNTRIGGGGGEATKRKGREGENRRRRPSKCAAKTGVTWRSKRGKGIQRTPLVLQSDMYLEAKELPKAVFVEGGRYSARNSRLGLVADAFVDGRLGRGRVACDVGGLVVRSFLVVPLLLEGFVLLQVVHLDFYAGRLATVHLRIVIQMRWRGGEADATRTAKTSVGKFLESLEHHGLECHRVIMIIITLACSF